MQVFGISSGAALWHCHAQDALGRPQRSYQSAYALTRRQANTRRYAVQGGKDLALVSKEVRDDGTVLFKFGSEAEAAAASDSASEEAQDEPAPQAATPPEAAVKSVKKEEDEQSAEQAPEAPTAPGTESSNGQAAAGSNGSGAALTVPSSMKELHDLKVSDLKDLCRDHNVKGYTKMRKQQLIDALVRELFAPV